MDAAVRQTWATSRSTCSTTTGFRADILRLHGRGAVRMAVSSDNSSPASGQFGSYRVFPRDVVFFFLLWPLGVDRGVIRVRSCFGRFIDRSLSNQIAAAFYLSPVLFFSLVILVYLLLFLMLCSSCFLLLVLFFISSVLSVFLSVFSIRLVRAVSSFLSSCFLLFSFLISYFCCVLFFCYSVILLLFVFCFLYSGSLLCHAFFSFLICFSLCLYAFFFVSSLLLVSVCSAGLSSCSSFLLFFCCSFVFVYFCFSVLLCLIFLLFFLFWFVSILISREPLPLLANLVGVTLSPGASDNGTVDILPGNYSSRAAIGSGHAFSAIPTGPTAWC